MDLLQHTNTPVSLPGRDSAAELRWIHDLYRLSHEGLFQDEGIPWRVLQHVVTGLSADGGILAMTDEEHPESLCIVATVGMPGELMDCRILIGEGVMGRVARERRAIRQDIGTQSDFDFTGARITRHDVPVSTLCWPLVVNDALIGVLCVKRHRGDEGFSEYEVERGATLVSLVTLVAENFRMHREHRLRIDALSRLNAEVVTQSAQIMTINAQLEDAQHQLLQSEKMASIGQLAAGVAHEINNPIGFVYSNLGTLDGYLKDLFTLIEAYVPLEAGATEDVREAVQALKRNIDLNFLRSDIVELMLESKDGITRVKKIVQDLKDFSHQGGYDAFQWAELHEGIDSTLNIVNNEIKYKAKIVREYGELPEIQCLPSQLNQVFMNILMNAAHAIDQNGTITVRSGVRGAEVWVEVRDTGSGIAPENLNRIFDPFFTTKPVGKGTGLGLSISYRIIMEHRGTISVRRNDTAGVTFLIRLPVDVEAPKTTTVGST